MLFWVLCAIVTAIGIAFIMRPLLAAKPAATSTADANLAIYRDQLDEITRELERGILSEQEAEAAKLEVSRRILAVDEASPEPASQSSGGLSENHLGRLAMAGTVGIVAFAISGYLMLGSPGLPGQPHAERRKADPHKLPLHELIARVEARLEAQPDDARGWDVIAPIYLKQGQYRKAARAYQRAIALNGENDRRLAQFAEAVLGASNGEVTDAVKDAYQRLLQRRPDYLPAQFWLAVRHQQDGEAEKAASAFAKLLDNPDLTPQMRALVRERLAAAQGKTAPAGSAAPAASSGSGQAPVLSRDAREQMARLTPEQRQARIRQMVEGLAERLNADGGELAEWQRLLRAQTVLGDRDKALASLAKARAAFANEPDKLKQLEAFAAGLGLVQGDAGRAN